MTPEQVAKSGTEHAHQSAVFCWASQQIEIYPCLKWMFAIPNGGNRDPVTAARLKAEGVKSGVSDICLPFPRRGYHSFFIEMKKPGEKESENQKLFGAFLTAEGSLYACFDHWEKARDGIEWYLYDDPPF